MTRRSTGRRGGGRPGLTGPFLRSVELLRDGISSFDPYPFSIPAIRNLDTLELHPRVTFFVGENGSGKSTLLEAIAIALGLNAEGGSRNFNFATRRSESELHRHLRLIRGMRQPSDSYFLRAESYFNVGTEIEARQLDPYGGVPIHEQSHGESFLRLITERFWGDGIYLLDEPEAALSPARQLAFLTAFHDLVHGRHSQLIIATHSPILMAYPDATILDFGPDGIHPVAYEDTEHFQLTLDFLSHRQAYLHRLIALPDPAAEPET